MQRLFVGMLLLLLPVLAFGQAQTTGRISGHVVDYQNQPVVGATIQITSLALSGPRAMTTDINGNFLASLLPPGDYTVTVTMVELNPAKATLRIGIGQTVPLEIKLQKGAEITEEVTVTGNTSKMETTAVGENFSYEKKVDELPITDRSINNVASLSPNISFGPNGMAISGAMTTDSVVLLDGAEISDPYFGNDIPIYMEDALDEVQVLTSGVSARYGRFQGGVVNATTRSGTNDISFGFRTDLRKEKWNSLDPWTKNVPEAKKQSDKLNKTYQGIVGGPILKDRLWFFFGGRTIPTLKTVNFTSHPANSSAEEPFTTVTDERRYQMKLKGAISSSHTIEASYLSFKQTANDRAYNVPADLLALAKDDNKKSSRTLTYQGVLSDKSFLDVQVTQKRDSWALGGTDPNRSPVTEYRQDGVRSWNNHEWDFNDPSIRDNDTFGANLTYVIPSAKYGEHTIEAGFQAIKSTIAGENRQSPSGYNLREADNLFNPLLNATNDDPHNTLYKFNSFFEDGGYSIRFKAMRWNGQQDTNNKALYVTDTWQIGNWRFDAGLRWEKYDTNSPSPSLQIDIKALAPRMGVTFNLNKDWQIQAFYGKYVSRINDGVLINNSGISAAPRVVSLYTGPTTDWLTWQQMEAVLRNDANWAYTLDVTDPRQPTQFMDKNLDAPYSNDFNLSVRHAFPKNSGSVTVTFTRRDFKKLMENYRGGQGVSIIHDPFNPEVLMDPIDTTIWKNCSECKRKYEAMTVTFDFQPGQRWEIGGNYTLSYLKGNYEGENLNQPAVGSIIGDFPLSWDMEHGAPYGYLSADARHRLRVWGNYRFDFKRFGTLTLGGIFFFRSGYPWSKGGNVNYIDRPEYNNERGDSYFYYTNGRGTERDPASYQFDLTSRYQFSIPGLRKLNTFAKLDIQNFFNHKRLIAPITGGTVAPDGNGGYVFVPAVNIGDPASAASYQTPRSFWLTIGVNY